MIEPFLRNQYSRELKRKVSRRLMTMIKLYIRFCMDINNVSEKRCQHKDFADRYQQCRLYFESIPGTMAVKPMADKVLFGRDFLLSILPKEFNIHYRPALKEFNEIVQFCMDERRSRHEISNFHAKELQEN